MSASGPSDPLVFKNLLLTVGLNEPFPMSITTTVPGPVAQLVANLTADPRGCEFDIGPVALFCGD